MLDLRRKLVVVRIVSTGAEVGAEEAEEGRTRTRDGRD